MKRLAVMIPLLFSGLATANTAFADTPAVKSDSLLTQLQPKLVDKAGKAVTAAALGKPKYIAYYFSASWCGPCRAFSPKLAAEYEALKKGGVQVVLAGCDRDKKSMLAYMNSAGHQQPWPGVWTLRRRRNQPGNQIRNEHLSRQRL